MTCELVIGEKSHPAIVRDLSPAGVFVQTRVKLEPGARLELLIQEGDGLPEIRAEARVARHRVVPPRLQAAVHGGVGLELLDPPEAFHELVARARRPEVNAALRSPEAEWPGAAGVRTFRVRVTQHGKPGSRIVTVRAENMPGARARALARVGRGWKIADIQEE